MTSVISVIVVFVSLMLAIASKAAELFGAVLCESVLSIKDQALCGDSTEDTCRHTNATVIRAAR
eukprot:scaffold68734_cov54-Cyclotella_meneghiniana.AAC.2